MANLSIRNLDDDVVVSLKARARRHDRSLEAEIRAILAAAARQPAELVDLRVLAERIAAMTPAGSRTDSVELLREDRGR